MRSKSSRKPAPKPVLRKWRNLPPAGIGLTPTMQARPIIKTTVNEVHRGCVLDDFCELQPVPFNVFLGEHAAMSLLGYHAISANDWNDPCRNCGRAEAMTYFEYTQNHRNGKPNYDSVRSFTVCFECLHVIETIFVPRENANVKDSDAA